MTTSPVVTVTDELIAELEVVAVIEIGDPDHETGAYDSLEIIPNEVEFIDGEKLCRQSEALALVAGLRERIAEQEAQIKALQSGENSWQSGYDEGRRMGGKHCALTIDQLRAELAALNAKLDASKFCADVADDLRAELAATKAQEPVAWMLKNEKGRIEEILPYMPCASDMQPYWPEPFPLYAAPVQQVSVQDGFERYRLADKFCEQRLVTDDRVRAIVVDAFASGYGFGIAAAPVAKQVVMPELWQSAVNNVAGYAHLFNSGCGIISEIRAEHARLNAADQAEGDQDE